MLFTTVHFNWFAAQNCNCFWIENSLTVNFHFLVFTEFSDVSVSSLGICFYLALGKRFILEYLFFNQNLSVSLRFYVLYFSAKIGHIRATSFLYNYSEEPCYRELCKTSAFGTWEWQGLLGTALVV